MKYYLDNSYQMLQSTSDCADCMICPQKLYLDITQDCNLWCKMCRSEKSVCQKIMPLDLFKRIVDETCPYVRSYSLFNWGEPLLLKDFCERVRYVNQRKRQDCNVEISTNGMLLSDQMIAFLLSEKVNVIVSVDSADKIDFEAIRRGSNFERIMENAKNLAIAYKDFPPQQSPSFYISIQKDNQHQILEIVKLAHSLDIKRIGCGIVVSPSEYAPTQDEALCHELERAYRFIENNDMFLEVYPTKVGNYVFADGRYKNLSGFIVNTICNAPIVSAVIEYSGNVYLCCNVGDYVGNISDGSFLEIWKGERYNKLRRNVNDPGNMPHKCINCSWFNRN